MKANSCAAIFLILLLAASTVPATAEHHIPSKGFRAEFLRDLDDVEEKVLGLAKAMPADSYGWEPSEGVRSVSEAFMHLAGANFFFPTVLGTQPPEGLDVQNLEKITDKKKVLKTLEQSFDHLRQAVLKVSDEELDKEVPFFGGQKASIRFVLYNAGRHVHEHLGQAIAYARSNDVAPPWSGGGN